MFNHYYIEMNLTDGSWVKCSDIMEDKNEAVKAFHQKQKNMPMSSLRLISSLVILQTPTK